MPAQESEARNVQAHIAARQTFKRFSPVLHRLTRTQHIFWDKLPVRSVSFPFRIFRSCVFRAPHRRLDNELRPPQLSIHPSIHSSVRLSIFPLSLGRLCLRSRYDTPPAGRAGSLGCATASTDRISSPLNWPNWPAQLLLLLLQAVTRRPCRRIFNACHDAFVKFRPPTTTTTTASHWK